jgi:hypothetical protein
MPRKLGQTVRFVDKDNGQAGIYPSVGGIVSVSTMVLTANRAYYARIVPSRSMAITKVAFNVTSASGTDDPLDIGLYDSTLATKLASTGATTGKLNGAGGIQTVTVAWTLAAGTVYYAAFAANSTATLNSVQINANNAAALFGASAPQAEFMFLNSAYPLAAGPITPGGTISNFPLLAIRES